VKILLRLSLALSLCAWIGAAGAASGAGYQAQEQTANLLSASVSQQSHEGKSDRACGPEGLLVDPPDLTGPAYDCGRCHAEQSHWVKCTLMSTASGIINQTRFLWGAQPDAGPRYATAASEGLQLLPTYEDSGALVDDLLRRRCLGCHLGASGPSRPEGAQDDSESASPCVACHILTGSERIAGDQKLPGAGDKARSPRVTTAVPTSQCLHCHRGNRVGADYAGLFERDH